MSILKNLAEKLKDQLPDSIQPFLREANYRFGSKAGLIALQDEIGDLQQQWRTIIANSNTTQDRDPDKPHVLFVTGYGLGTGFITKEAVLMMSLYQRGCRISTLLCDMTLPACEFNAAGNHNPPAGAASAGLSEDAKLARCKRCSTNAVETFSSLPVELYRYHQYLSAEDLKFAQELTKDVPFKTFRNFQYEGIRVGDDVFASVLRATFKGTVDDTPLNRTLVKRYLISGVMMARAAEKAYNDLKPDRIVLMHGVYLTHGIATQVANKLGIPVIVHPGFGGIRKNAIMLSHKETYHKTLVYEPNEIWNQVELSQEQRNKTLNYAFSKQSGGVDYVNYHPNPIENTQELYETLNIDNSKEIVSLYSNVIWDAQIYYDGNAFENILEWMKFSITELAKNDKVWLVIRIHPAEVKGGLPTKQSFVKEIKRWFPVLPDNVRVIPPESDLSSYTLAEQSRATIIYGTKMGLELALRGIPVVVCGETFSRGKGFTMDVTSKEQYSDLLKTIQNVERLDQGTVERAIKYAHYLYFRKMFDFPYLTITDYKTQTGKKIAISSLEDLTVGSDPSLDALCRTIIDLAPAHLS